MESLVYVGMDVHKESYSLCAYAPSTGEFFGEAKIEASAQMVAKYLEALKEKAEGAKFVVAYEAGCLGFSLYKSLAKLGIECKIIAPTTLSKSPDSGMKKSDRKDARMLARNLAFGTCRFVAIPDEVDNETREYIRMRADHKKALKKLKQQILAFCLRCGKEYGGSTYWTPSHIAFLKGLELSGLLKETMDEYIDTYERSMEKLSRLDGKILERSDEKRYKERTDKLSCMKGITKCGALTIVSEIGDFSRFGTPAELCSYLGLVPGEHSSAGVGPRMGITKLGNAIVRTQLVESAQSIVRGAPGKKSKRTVAKQAASPAAVVSYCDKAADRLMRKYRQLVARGVHRNKAVTAVARELACFVWGLMNGKIEGRQQQPAKAS